MICWSGMTTEGREWNDSLEEVIRKLATRARYDFEILINVHLKNKRVSGNFEGVDTVLLVLRMSSKEEREGGLVIIIQWQGGGGWPSPSR